MNQPLPKSSDVFDNDRSQQVADLSQKVFKRLPERVAFPGGKSRSAFIVDMVDDLYVFARREDQVDAQLEGIVLKNLAPSKRVPGLKAIVGEWVVQNFVPGARLPIVLNETDDMAEKERLVGSALESLIFIHEAANSANLEHRVPKIGTADKWLWNRAGAAKRISKSLKLPVPDLDREKLVKLMDVKRDEFVK